MFSCRAPASGLVTGAGRLLQCPGVGRGASFALVKSASTGLARTILVSATTSDSSYWPTDRTGQKRGSRVHKARRSDLFCPVGWSRVPLHPSGGPGRSRKEYHNSLQISLHAGRVLGPTECPARCSDEHCRTAECSKCFASGTATVKVWCCSSRGLQSGHIVSLAHCWFWPVSGS